MKAQLDVLAAPKLNFDGVGDCTIESPPNLKAGAGAGSEVSVAVPLKVKPDGAGAAGDAPNANGRGPVAVEAEPKPNFGAPGGSAGCEAPNDGAGPEPKRLFDWEPEDISGAIGRLVVCDVSAFVAI